MPEENKEHRLNDEDMKNVSGGNVNINGHIYEFYGTLYEYCHNCQANRTFAIFKDNDGNTIHRCAHCRNQHFHNF